MNRGKRIHVNFPQESEEMYNKILELAKTEHRSASAMILILLEKYFESENSKNSDKNP